MLDISDMNMTCSHIRQAFMRMSSPVVKYGIICSMMVVSCFLRGFSFVKFGISSLPLILFKNSRVVLIHGASTYSVGCVLVNAVPSIPAMI